MPKEFFAEQREQSAVKAEIVSKYFNAWADIMIGQARPRDGGRIAYIDLFAGPGRYEDGAKSTPLMVLERAIAKPALGERLMALFNDIKPANVASLQSAIDSLPGIERLSYQP
jgi:three-Cys-motif partner protein